MSAALLKPLAQSFAVIAFISGQFARWRHCVDAELCDLTIMHIARCQEQDAAPTFRVTDGMEFGVASVAEEAQGFRPRGWTGSTKMLKLRGNW